MKCFIRTYSSCLLSEVEVSMDFPSFRQLGDEHVLLPQLEVSMGFPSFWQLGDERVLLPQVQAVWWAFDMLPLF